jgi:hypothetical protein
MIRFEGRLWKDGDFWLVEVPLLDIMTQGRSQNEALKMIKDAVESLVNQPRFGIEVHRTGTRAFDIGSHDSAPLIALMLRRQREARGISLSEMATRLGQSSKNAYARYEQGKAAPTLAKLVELLEAVDPKRDLVLRQGR